MSDHADTIRRALSYPAGDHHFRCAFSQSGGIAACDCYARDSAAAHAALDALLAERQQAIDALREALLRLEKVDGNLALANYDAQVILRAALVKLGEKP